MTMTFVPAWVSALMNETWLDALASSGPTTVARGEAGLLSAFLAAAEHDVGVRVVELLGDERDRLGRPRRPSPRVGPESSPAAQPVAMRAMVAAVAAMVAIRRVRVARPLRLRNNSIVFSFLRAPGARR